MAAEDSLGLVGVTIDDKYVVESVVGEGGFGVVYRAMHKVWQKPVAIKCFKTLMDVTPAMRQQLLKDFIQEGALLSELSARSASIVQARDVGTLSLPSGAWIPYMVLEWLEGETLEDFAERRGMFAWPLDKVMAVLEPIAMALEIAHTRNIAHRDIKPANIFVVGEVGSDHMLVKLLDFGIAKVVQSAAEQGFTQTGGQVTSFTPSYGAPEQFSRKHGATGPWTDVYALALIAVELLTGKYALEGEDFIQLGMSSADPNRRPTPRALGLDVGEQVEAVLAKALAISPQQRYQTAGEFWNAMRMAVGAQPLKRGTSGELRANTVPRQGGPSVPILPDGRTSSREALAATTAVPSATYTPVQTQPKKFPVAAVILGVFVLAGVGAGAAILLTKSSATKNDAAASSADDKKKPSKKAGDDDDGPAASSATPIAKKGPPCPDGMVEIAGGQFFMGSDGKDADDDEKPVHNVTLSPFCMDKHEVTVADYKACSDGGKCLPAKTDVDFEDMTDVDKKAFSPLCTLRDPAGKSDHPINCVDWGRADNFCKRMGKRLPTEAEWEFAARGPDGRIYPWGDDPPGPKFLNACGKECVDWGKKVGEQLIAMYDEDDGFPATAPVGKFPAGASRYGLLDIVGNVWEWTADWSGDYGKNDETNPKGPADGKHKVIRGGAWNGGKASWVRPSQRYDLAPESFSHVVGFRCAADQNK